MRTRPIHAGALLRTVIAASALTLGIAGCSSSAVTGKGTGSPSPSVAASLPGASTASTPPVQSPAAPSSSPAPITSASSTAGPGATALSAKLLTAAEVGDGFTETAFNGKDTSLPCDPKGTPGVDEQIPPTIKVGRDFVQTSLQAQLEEDLQVYSDESTTAKALSAVKRGLNCSSGNLYADDGTAVKVTISSATAIPATGPVQGGSAWALKGATIAGLAVIVKYSDTHIALLTFFAPTGTPSSKLPALSTLVSAATRKFLS